MPTPRTYLDHAATTPVLPAARAAMAEALAHWANPSSPHREGRAARAVLEEARARIAEALQWRGRLIFTSGASEALAIVLKRAKADRLCVSAVEHDAVLRAAPEAIRLPVDAKGLVDLASVSGACPLVAVQHANNETGILQPVDDCLRSVRERGGLVLVDCAQTAGKLPLPDADFIAVSAHKLGGPPGVGALLVRDPATLEAVGGQEQGYRPGTENLPAILGFAAAVETGLDWIGAAEPLRKRLDVAILAAGGHVVGAAAPRIPTIGAYRMPGRAATAQLIQFDLAGFAVSAGSACASGSLKPSHVLAAMGMDESAAREVLRISFGPGLDAADIDAFAASWSAFRSRSRAA